MKGIGRRFVGWRSVPVREGYRICRRSLFKRTADLHRYDLIIPVPPCALSSTRFIDTGGVKRYYPALLWAILELNQ
ncbi:MAG: hypothetical protein JW838_04195 [Spirochaetes bacterium]|nr:hypothetical protein [Spirochaetota bacterium]